MFQEARAPRILVHYPPFGAAKWERLAGLAAAGVELRPTLRPERELELLRNYG